MQKITNIILAPVRLVAYILIMLGFGLAYFCVWAAK
jgi:hypothetical protein